jgi:hypothetical protein
MLHSRIESRQGFALVKVIIVALIGFIAIALLLPPLRQAREAEARTQTHNNLKQVALCVHSFSDTYRRLPPAFDKFGVVDFEASVHVHLLPYMESSPFFKKFVQAKGGGGTNMTSLPFYISPSDNTVHANGAGVQNFAANLRVFSAMGFDTRYDAAMPPLSVVEPGPKAALVDLARGDGTYNTILFATKFATCADGGSYYAAEPSSKWAAFFGQSAALRRAHPADATATFQLSPRREECVISPLMAQSFTTGYLSVALADGSVRMIDPNISPETWNRALQPNDGKELGSDWDR